MRDIQSSRKPSPTSSPHRYNGPTAEIPPYQVTKIHQLPLPQRVRKILKYVDTGIYIENVARSSTTSDVFNAIAEGRRREILDVLITGEKAVGAIVNDLSMSQPQVSKHLRVLSEVGLVKCRAEGRRRLYRLEPSHLRPLHDWMEKYERALNERLDRMDDYIKELQQKGEPQ